jgi:hypothetical protein
MDLVLICILSMADAALWLVVFDMLAGFVACEASNKLLLDWIEDPRCSIATTICML